MSISKPDIIVEIPNMSIQSINEAIFIVREMIVSHNQIATQVINMNSLSMVEKMTIKEVVLFLYDHDILWDIEHESWSKSK